MLKSALLKPAPLRKRLWQAGIALALFMVTVAVTNQFVGPDKAVTPSMLGHDFLPFYSAGTFVRNGMPDLLYDLPMTKATEHEIAAKNNLDIGKSFGPFWNPPFYSWIFVPLARMPYHDALMYWTLLNVIALMTAIVLLRRFFPVDCDWRTTLLVPLLLLTSMPFIQAISHGQNTFTSLMLVAMIVTAWRQRRALSAGVACGLLMYKPQLAAVLAIVMTLDLGWRVLLSTGCTCSLLFIITGLTLPGSFDDYLHQLPLNLHFMQVESTYLWERHVTFKGFWRLLFQGRSAGEAIFLVRALTLACCGAVACGLLFALRKLKSKSTDVHPWSEDSTSLRRDRLISATIAATPLLMPFYFDYDLLLLAVPASLLGAELSGRAIGAKLDKSDRWLLGCWTLMFLWMMINPGMGNTTHVNGTTILLTCVAGLLIRRASRTSVEAMVKPTELRVQHMASQRAAA